MKRLKTPKTNNRIRSKTMAKRGICLTVLLLLLGPALGGCSNYDNALHPYTHTDTPVEPVVANPIRPPVWCYSTMGSVDCYAHPQADSPDRLINVSPPELYPQTRDDYKKAVANDQSR
jgi:hypothetical protein